METFQFVQKKISEKTGFTSYLFQNPQYTLTIHTVKDGSGEEILYPFKAKVIGKNIDITPDINVFSKESAELCLPPSVSMDRFVPFRDSLNNVPGLMDALKEIIEKVEDGYYD